MSDREERRSRSRSKSRSRSRSHPRMKRGVGEVDVNVVSPDMEVYRPLTERAFEAAGSTGSDVLTIQDFLCSGANAKNISSALRDLDEDRIVECLRRAIAEISREFEARDRIRWPYMLLTARFRRELRAAGAKTLPFDGELGRDRHGRNDRGRGERGRGERERERSRDRREVRRGRSRSPLSSRDRRLVEDFIDRNRLDRRCAEVLKYELSVRDIHRVIDEGFSIRASNPSREVMLRIKDVQSRRNAGGRSRSRSRSPRR